MPRCMAVHGYSRLVLCLPKRQQLFPTPVNWEVNRYYNGGTCSGVTSAIGFTDINSRHRNCVWGSEALIACCAAQSLQRLPCNIKSCSYCGMQWSSTLWIEKRIRCFTLSCVSHRFAKSCVVMEGVPGDHETVLFALPHPVPYVLLFYWQKSFH